MFSIRRLGLVGLAFAACLGGSPMVMASQHVLPSLLLVGMDSESWVQDVQSGLLSTGHFSQVDYQWQNTVNTAVFANYDAIITWSDSSYPDSNAVGNAFADFIDSGKGLVAMVFDDEGSLSIQGRYNAQKYFCFQDHTNYVQEQGTRELLDLANSNLAHPVFAGVTSFDGGFSSYHLDDSAVHAGQVIGHYANGENFAAACTAGSKNQNRVDLNFFPPSDRSRSDFWNTATDGWKLMANAALFTLGTNGNAYHPSGSNGDPQFYGFMGQSFQVHGSSNTVYNIVSSPSLQYNANFTYLESGSCRKGTECFSHAGNYFGSVGVQLKDATGLSHSLLIQSGSAASGLSLVQLDGSSLDVGASFSIGMYNVTRSNLFEVELLSEEFAIRVENSDWFVNQRVSVGRDLLADIASYRKAVKSHSGADESELRVNLPHGILGQTWSNQVYPNRWKHIEGQLFDYIIADGIFGTDFKYNRF